MFLAASNVGYKIVNQDDLAINTMWAWMGALGFSRFSGIISPSYNVYRLKYNAVIDYYNYLFRTSTFITEITRNSTGVWESRLRLYPQAFFEIRCPVPPIEEQRAIVNYIEAQTGMTDRVVASLTQQITLLQEYRTALIHESVSGQKKITV